MLKPSSIVGLDWRLRNLGFLEFIMVAEPYGATHTVSRWPFGKDVDWGTGDFEYNQWPFQEPNIPTKYGPIWYSTSTSILGSWNWICELACADYLATLAEKCGEDSESSPQFSALQSEPREAKKKGPFSASFAYLCVPKQKCFDQSAWKLAI